MQLNLDYTFHYNLVGRDIYQNVTDWSGSTADNWHSFVVLPTGVSEDKGLVEKVRDIRIYPNPSRGISRVYGVKETKISIYDLSGRLIGERELKEGEQKIDLRDLGSGVYLLGPEKGLPTKKVVVLR